MNKDSIERLVRLAKKEGKATVISETLGRPCTVSVIKDMRQAHAKLKNRKAEPANVAFRKGEHSLKSSIDHLRKRLTTEYGGYDSTAMCLIETNKTQRKVEIMMPNCHYYIVVVIF